MKKTLLTLSALALTMLMGSCSTKDDMSMATSEPTASTSPSASPNITTVMPSTTDNTLPGMMDGMTDGMMDGANGANGTDSVLPGSTTIPESTGVTSMDKAKRVIEQIEDELERLSEVEDAEVVIAGSKAAVGVEFDDQYRTGLDERMRKIIKERINSVIGGINTVAITADEGVRDAIESLGERLDTMGDMAALQSDLDAIIKKINGMNA